ncbi:MAG: hypothetical protein BMS9Abin20_0384 [Acidimicrobiia bacterium]|nr:MAG: hypothetical protein BMS9Abin20_0384 [Acidimicrobiia bacterium]
MELSSMDIEERRFSTALRGYNRSEVQSFRIEVGRTVRGLEEHIAIEQTRAAESQRELTELRAKIDDMLEDATQARHKIIEEAKREALAITARVGSLEDASTLADAAERAAAIVAEAETKAALRLKDVGRVKEAARTEAERIVAAAQQDAAATEAEATQVLDDARRQARATRAEVETERAAIVTEVADLKRIAEATRSGEGDLEALESANVILRSGNEITIDLREVAVVNAEPKSVSA